MVDASTNSVKFGVDHVDDLTGMMNEMTARGWTGMMSFLHIDWLKIEDTIDEDTGDIVKSAGENFAEISTKIMQVSTLFTLAWKLKSMFRRMQQAMERSILMKKRQWDATNDVLIYKWLQSKEEQRNILSSPNSLKKAIREDSKHSNGLPKNSTFAGFIRRP